MVKVGPSISFCARGESVKQIAEIQLPSRNVALNTLVDVGCIFCSFSVCLCVRVIFW